MTTTDKPREVPCACGRDYVIVRVNGAYRAHNVPAWRGGECSMSGKRVPAEMIAKADARDAERAERERYAALAPAVREAEWEYGRLTRIAGEAQRALDAAVANMAEARERVEAAREALAEADAQRAASIPATPDDDEATA